MTREGVQSDPTSREQFDVLIVVSHLGAGGMQRVVTALANAWSESGYKVGVVVRTPHVTEAFLLSPAVTRIELSAVAFQRRLFYIATIFSIFLWARRFRSLVRKSKTRRVVSFIRTTNVPVILACLGLKKVRVIVSERNDPLRQNLGISAPFWNQMSRLFYRYADIVTANSQGILSAMEAYVPRKKLAFTPNPLTVPITQTAKSFEGPTVLAVGRLVPQKGYDVLLAAFARVAAEEPAWQLCVLGDGPLRGELEDQARGLEIDRRIVWAGQDLDPFPYYRGADIFVMSSRYEGTPNALLEAMSCGRAVVVTDASPGPLELVEDNVSGLVVPVDNLVALAAAVLRLIRDTDLRLRLGKNAQARVKACPPEQAIAIWSKVLALTKDPALSDSKAL